MFNILRKILKVKLKEINYNKKYKKIINLYKIIKYKKEKKYFNNFNILCNNNLSKNNIISELKKSSPSLGLIKKKINIYKIINNYLYFKSNTLSILTDKIFFNGEHNILNKIIHIFNLNFNILCKDFIINIYQIYQFKFLNANTILLIVSLLNKETIFKLYHIAYLLKLNIIIEVHNFKELNIAMYLKKSLIGINNRNLYTFLQSLIVVKKLSLCFNNDKIIISESSINNKIDIKDIKNLNINFFLVGEIFMKSKNCGKKLFKLFK